MLVQRTYVSLDNMPHCTTLLPEWSLFYRHSNRNSWFWSRNTLRWREERQQCNQQSLAGDAPSNLPQPQPELQNQMPLNLSCPNSPPCLLRALLWPWPQPLLPVCMIPLPLTLALHLPSSQSLWTPFQLLVSFAGWLGLGPAPALFFVVPWILPTHLRAEVLKNRLFFQGEFSEVLSLHLPGEIHWL